MKQPLSEREFFFTLKLTANGGSRGRRSVVLVKPPACRRFARRGTIRPATAVQPRHAREAEAAHLEVHRSTQRFPNGKPPTGGNEDPDGSPPLHMGQRAWAASANAADTRRWESSPNQIRQSAPQSRETPGNSRCLPQNTPFVRGCERPNRTNASDFDQTARGRQSVARGHSES